MKANLEPIISEGESTFYANRFDVPGFDHPFHYHPEIEITYIERGTGTVIIGDHIGSFDPGFLCLIGPNLPHIFRHSSPPPQGAVSEVLQFRCPLSNERSHAFGGAEWRSFRKLLERAQQGLAFGKPTAERACKHLQDIRLSDGLKRWQHFIALAECLIAAKSTSLASTGYSNSYSAHSSDRIERICQYILEHATTDLSHRDIADRFHLAPASFSRIFKKATNRTFQEFLGEIRLGNACRLLSESDDTITEIAFASGYKNLSNFNRRFKERYQSTPKEWRDQFKKTQR